ncbi:MAG: gliding motility protein GldL [Paludibacteraceae bacterium]|nr:gliding motility protein GldL [Paludibacteraceae bacterium]
MATEKANAYQSWLDSFEGKKESKFMTWYHSYQGKKIVNIVYSAGASVVIVGALFKILHWPGASIVLMIGMFTEAFLFIIGVFEVPHEEFHWGNIFPQLLEYGSPEERLIRARDEMGMAPQLGGQQSAAQGPANPTSTSLSESEMEALKAGIGDLAKTAGQLSELGKLATTTNKLNEQMEAASTAAGQFAQSAGTLGQKSEELNNAYTAIVNDLQGAVDNTKNYSQSVEAMNAKLGSINSIYELQLNTIQAQADAFKAQTEQVKSMTEGIKSMAEMTADAMKSSEAYQAGAKQLAGQIADLNKVYGNMLNALV